MLRFFLFIFMCTLVVMPSSAFAQNVSSAVANRQQELQNQLDQYEQLGGDDAYNNLYNPEKLLEEVDNTDASGSGSATTE